MATTTNRRLPAMLLVALAVVASSLVQTPQAYAAKGRPKCLGKKATIVGNNKANTIKGTKKADVIVAKGGNDRILGRGGADRICAGGGKDNIFGGGGNDRMDGGKGNDECRQQAGTGPKKNCEGPKLQLTVSKAGSGAGTVTSSPAGVDCGLNCSLNVIEGDSVSLAATAASGSSFAGWAGGCTGTSGCSVVMSKAQSVIATFTADPAPPPPPSFSLAITTSGTGSGTISSSPGGINCGSDCSEVYTQGTSVTLSVTGSAGSVFDGWSGACSGTGSCVLTMEAAKTANAAFTKVSYNLHVDRVFQGTGATGTVTSAPTGINCGADCDQVYDHGTSITLTATPGSGSQFSSWSGCDSGTGNPCSISLAGATTATATFVKVWDLGVTKDGSGSGTVTSSPSGINCGVTCTANFAEGSNVTLTATANSGSRFDSWSGCDSVAGNQCTVTNLTAPKSVTATFIKVWSVTVTKDGTGSGTVTSSPSGVNCGSTCTASYDQGTTVTLTATPASGSRFGSWSGCDSTTGNQCNLNMTAAKSVTATFVKVWDLNVSLAGTGSGTVTSSPSGINCGSDCSETYDQGTSVTLTATASAGSRFGSWSGCDSEAGSQCTVSMTSAKSVIATFVKLWDLTVSKDGSGSGTVTSSPAGINCGSDCTETYDQGTSVTLTGTSSAGSRFGSWSGCDSTAGNQCTVNINSAESVTATFVKVWDLSVTKAGSGSGTVTSSPAGINCGSDCSETYDQGTSVTLTGTAASGSRFGSWSGCDSEAGNQCTVNVNSVESVTATFVKVWDLSVTKAGSGSGTVTSSPAGINCGGDCSETYDQGTSVTLTATPSAGSRFGSWSGCDSEAGNQCTVDMMSAESVIATFVKVWDLTVSKDGSGSGTVTSSPAGINCGGDCSETYDQGTSVTLTATPASGSRFDSWSGCDSTAGNQCTVNMTAAKSVTATFVKVWDFTVSKDGSGTGTVTSSPSGINCGSDCSETYDQGTSVTLTATAASGSRFDAWSGCDSAAGNQCTVNVNSVESVNATFIKVWDLTVTKTGSGSGTVTSSPSGINCGGTCTAAFDQGASVTLTATPDSGSLFTGWSGEGCSGTGTCIVTMNAAKSITADFTPGRVLTLTKSGTGGGTVTSSPSGIGCGGDCSETYLDGTVVTLTGTPDGTSTFTGWTGCDSPSGNQCTMTMNANKTVNAEFTRITFNLQVNRTMPNGSSGTVTSSPSGINCGSDCDESYVTGTEVTLTATADSGSQFVSWSSCDSVVGNQCTVTMSSAKTVTATFKKVWDLTVTKDGGSGGGAGTVTSSPAGINCGGDCTETYDHGTVVTLTAVASAGSRFSGWSGEGCSGTGTCVVTMDATRNVTANFVKQWTLTVNVTGVTAGTVTSDAGHPGINCPGDCQEVYDHNVTVTLTRSNPVGFTGWSGGGCSGTGATCVVTLTADTTVTAAWF